jgi:hypothetical protein
MVHPVLGTADARHLHKIRSTSWKRLKKIAIIFMMAIFFKQMSMCGFCETHSPLNHLAGLAGAATESRYL